MHSMVMNATGIHFKGPYRNREFQKCVQRQLQTGRTSVLEVHGITSILRQQGFVLDPQIDNKSLYDPDNLYQKLAKYGSTLSWKPDWQAFDLAWKVTAKAFARPERLPFLTPLSLKEVSGEVKLSKSSGAPYFTKKGNVLKPSIDLAYRILNGERKPDPCVAYHRLQHGDEGPKTRLVWGYPLAMTLLEGIFAAPLISRYLSLRTPMMFGLTKVAIAARISRIRNHGCQYGFDFSGFDSSIHPKLISRAFWILRTWFEQTPEVHELFNLLENYFVFTPIIMPDGNVYQKTRGVPSGSWFTQLVDSIVNYFAMQYIMIVATGHPTNRESCVVLGDDSLLGLNHKLNMSEIVKIASNLGLTINLDKSHVGFDGFGTPFLGHTWDFSLPHRNARDVAIRMAYPERWTRIPEGTRYARSRMVAFMSDSYEAWSILRHVKPFDSYNVFGAACSADKPIIVTGYQLYMQAIYGDDWCGSKSLHPGVFFYGPIM